MTGWDSPWENELVAVLQDLLEQEVVRVREATAIASVDCVVLSGSDAWVDRFTAEEGPTGEIRDAVLAHARDRGLVLAIGTGFEAACRLGLLPGRLVANRSDSFLCRMVDLRVENVANPWAQRAVVGDVWRMPVRTDRGCFEIESPALERLERDGSILLRYQPERGAPEQAAPEPTGSEHGIAAIMNPGQNVLGVLPHPENVVDASLVEPQWPGLESGRVLFDSVVDWVESGARHGVVESER